MWYNIVVLLFTLILIHLYTDKINGTFGNKGVGFLVMKNKVLFNRVNRKTQKKTTNLSQVIDNFILILLLIFF